MKKADFISEHLRLLKDLELVQSGLVMPSSVLQKKYHDSDIEFDARPLVGLDIASFNLKEHELILDNAWPYLTRQAKKYFLYGLMIQNFHFLLGTGAAVDRVMTALVSAPTDQAVDVLNETFGGMSDVDIYYVSIWLKFLEVVHHDKVGLSGIFSNGIIHSPMSTMNQLD